jgi:hypothetical protein
VSDVHDHADRSPLELVAQLGELRERLDALEREPAELRCRRIVVLDIAGVERIVLEATPSSGSVRVLTDRTDGPTTAAELFAVDAVDGDPANAGVAFTDTGEVVGLLDVTSGRPPRWWDAGSDEHESEPRGAGTGIEPGAPGPGRASDRGGP